MRGTEIVYKLIKTGTYKKSCVFEKEGWEANYEQNVINEIKAITDARDENGKPCAVVTSIKQFGN